MYLKLSYLHSNREVILSFWWEEDVHSFLLIGLVTLRWSAHLDDVQLKRTKINQGLLPLYNARVSHRSKGRSFTLGPDW